MLQALGDDSAARDLLAATELRKSPGFGGDLDNDGDQIEAAWSPDGATIVFTATTNREESARAIVQQSLYSMPAGGGEPKRFTSDEASYEGPQFAPDGRALYARSTPRTDFVYNDERLVPFGLPDPQPRPVAFPFERAVDSFELSPDGETVYLLAEHEGRVRLFSAPATGGEVRELGKLESGTFGGLQVEGDESSPAIVANWGSAVSPPEVARIDPASGARKPLSAFNAVQVVAIDWQPIRGPANEINEAADEAIRRYPFIDASRQAAGGASYGGHLTNWLAVSTDRYRALVSHAGLYDLKTQWTTSDVAYSRERNLGGPPWEGNAVWKEQSPFWHTKKLKTPVLVTFGERDYRVPYNNGFEFFMLLQRQGVESRLVVFPEENHWILKGEDSRYFYEEVQDWLAKHSQ